MMATKGRDKDEKKKGRKGQKHDPPTSEDVNDSTPAKNNSILRRLSKKKSSGRGSSSQSLKALDSQPLPDCARNSPDLQSQNQSVVSVTSTSFTPASSDNVFPPDESSSDLQGELFPDDPEKVERSVVAADEVRRKEHAREHFHEEQLDNVLDMWVAEAEEADISVKAVQGESTQERLQHLFDAYRDKCVKTSHTVKQKTQELKQAKADHELVAKGHEMVRQTNQKEVSRLEGELEQLRGEMTGVEKERNDLTESNKEAVAAVDKLHQKIQDLEHVREDCIRLEKEKNELVHLKEAVEREREQLLRAKEEELLQNEKKIQDLEHVREDCTRLEKEKNELEKEKNELVHSKEAVEREKEQLLRAKEEELLQKQLDVQVEQRVEIEKLKTEIAQLNQECIQKDQKIQDLEKVKPEMECAVRNIAEESDTTTKMKRLQQTLKTYETKVGQLKQQLHEETQKRTEYEEKLASTAVVPQPMDDTSELVVNKLKQELEDAQQQCKETEERLHEQEAKREESQRSLESLQKAMKKLETCSSKSESDLDTYFEQILKLSEELTTMKTESEQQKKEIETLKRVEKNAERIEEENVQAATKLSETEAEVKMLQAEVVKAQHLKEKRSSETDLPVVAESGDTRAHIEEKLRMKILELKEKLKARDEELHDMKQQHGDTPLSNPLVSPTDSMKSSTGEVAALKMKLKEKEQKLQNIKTQVGSVEGVLQQHKEEREKLAQENKKLTQEKQSLKEHMKMQSQEVFSLKQKLHANQAKAEAQSKQQQEYMRLAEIAEQEVVKLKDQVESLTVERNESREETARMASAYEQAKNQDEQYQHMHTQFASLKEEAEKVKEEYTKLQEDYEILKATKEQYKQDFEEEKQEKEKAMKDLKEVEERNSSASHDVKKELDRLREESHQKDLLLQKENLAVQQLREQLATAERNYQEQLEYVEQLNKNQQAILQQKKDEVDKFQQEIQAKTAQVKQYKKQVDALQEKKEKEKPSQDVEELELKLAKSESTLEETKKQLARKALEMEVHFKKKLDEKDHELQHALKQNEFFVGQLKELKAKQESELRELETKQQIAQKETEMQLAQAEQQKTGMAMELSRMQKDRNREDEFSKAFQQEFDANKVLRAKCTELQNQLDSALDAVDGLTQQQEVLKQTLLDNGLQLPFEEPKPQYLVPSSAEETPPNQQGVVQHHPPVAISHKPIASPGVYNQHVDERSYMPPHSNAELKYQEQQAQRQMNLQQQITARSATNVNAFNSTQAPPVIPHAQRYPTAQQTSASAYENEAAVVGIPASAVGKPIVPRSHNPRHTSQLCAPVQSRNSAGEMGPFQRSYPEQAGGVGNGHQVQPHPPTVECSSHAPYNQVGQQHSQMEPPNPQNMGCGQQPQLHSQVQPEGIPLQQPYNTAVNAQGSAPVMQGVEGNLYPLTHGYQQAQVPVSPNVQPSCEQPPPFHAQDVQYGAQLHPANSSPTPTAVPIVVPVAETTPSVPQVPVSDVMGHDMHVGGNVLPKAHNIGSSGAAGSSQLQPSVSCTESEPDTDDNGVLMHHLNENILDTVAEVNENERVGDTRQIDSGLQSIPQDPNLQCVVCGKIFKIGQIQNFKRHVATCAGND